MANAVVSRFAPSPTGPLHLGHAFSAITAHDLARVAGGRFLLRIEDLDAARCRPHWEAAIRDDLRWLGLSWDGPVRRQSERRAAYAEALATLVDRGLVYPCGCNRAAIAAALSAPQEGVPLGPDGPVYPGTCRGRSMADHHDGEAIRLDMTRALATLDESRLNFEETGPEHTGHHRLETGDLVTGVGDIVLGRRETGEAAYHLAVTLDDADQGVTLVARGADLFEATKVHVVLQALLDLPTPRYHHHRLIRDEAGKRLAKRDDARALSRYRAEGMTPQDIRRRLDLPPASS